MEKEKNDKNQKDVPFLMPISEVFAVTGRGTVVTGRVKSGVIHKGDELEIVGIKETQKTAAVFIEQFRKFLDEAGEGQNIGVILRGIKKEDVVRGQVLATPGTVVAYNKFEAKCHISNEKEGGLALSNGERPQFRLNCRDFTGEVTLAEGIERVIPGTCVDMSVELIYPTVLEEGMSFSIFKKSHKIGTGIISTILP